MGCAVLCVIVTITTTVVHMSRLQSIKECSYTQATRTCTCYPLVQPSPSGPGTLLQPLHPVRPDQGVVYVFNGTPDCEVTHLRERERERETKNKLFAIRNLIKIEKSNIIGT